MIKKKYYFLFSSFEDAVELLLKHGARVDVEARMCWPGHHQHNCEERGRHSRSRINQAYASSDKLQCAIYYAIDGDQVMMYFKITYLVFTRLLCNSVGLWKTFKLSDV